MTRTFAAAAVLAAYYWVLAFDPFAPPSAAAQAEQQLQVDINASRDLFNARRFAEALAPTERLTTQLTRESIYHDRLARILHELKRPADEAAAWEKAMATSPTPVDACPMIAEAYDAAGKPGEAISAWQRCSELPPINPDFLLYLGQALLKADRPAEARQAFVRGLAVDDRYPDLHLLLGIRQFADGERDAARASFEKFLDQAPSRRAEVEVWLQRSGSVK